MTKMRWPINSAAILQAHWQCFLAAEGFTQCGPTSFQSDSAICVLSIAKLGRGRFNAKEEGLVEIFVVSSRFLSKS